MSRRQFFGMLLVALALLCGSGGAAAAGGVLVLQNDSTAYDLAPYMAVAVDPDGKWTIEQAAGADAALQYTDRPERTPNYGYSAAVRWIRLDIRNDTAKSMWLLQTDYAPIDRLDFYVAGGDGSFAHTRMGDSMPFGERPISNRSPTMQLQLEPGKQQTVFLRVETEGAMALPMKLYAPLVYTEREQSTYLLMGAYYGMMLVLTAFNIILAFSMRSRAYFYYVFINASTLLLFLSLNGIAYQYIWPDAVWWNNRSIVFFMCLSHIAALLFARSFLRITKQRFGTLYRLFVAMIAVELANMLVLLADYRTGLVLSVYSIGVIDVFIIVAAVISLRSGNRPARYFILGWGAFLLGAILSAMTDAGFIPMMPWLVYASQVGSVCEAVILSWGLAGRIHSIRKEKEIAIAQMNETRRLADSDDLTGLYNRRYVIAAFEQAVMRGGGSMSLMLLDVDYFKQVNDTYGHDTGDLVLQKLARVLRASFRPRDIVGRFGGEEFMVLLQDTNRDQAHRAAEFLLGTIRKQPFLIGEHTLSCTVSIGIAEWKGTPEDDFHQVLLRADEALYAAKRGGRDRVCEASWEGCGTAVGSKF
ncbi:sensor domain-containing diguanylate cyclase [Paenibacillus cymbidii]|uniref:sensor domain-containing diguanylate cyclase n=1 Tax=Paenibacillus cymbidii TaxID=1639034 RepID=UPI0010800A45|nr:diguanylate cyclase [Paenibacillus cymbidii]